MPTDLDSASYPSHNGRISVAPSVPRDRSQDRHAMVPSFLDQLLRFPSPEPVRVDQPAPAKQPAKQSDSTGSSDNSIEKEDSREAKDSGEEENVAAGPIVAQPATDPHSPSSPSDDSKDEAKRRSERSGSEINDRSTQSDSNLESDEPQVHNSKAEQELAEASSLSAVPNTPSTGEPSLVGSRVQRDVTSTTGEASVQTGNSSDSELPTVGAEIDARNASDHPKTSASSEAGSASRDGMRRVGMAPSENDRAFADPIDSNDVAQGSGKSRRRNDRVNSRTRTGGGNSVEEGGANERMVRESNGRNETQPASARIAQSSEQASAENGSLSNPSPTLAGTAAGQSIVPPAQVVSPTVMPTAPATASNQAASNNRNATSSSVTESWLGSNTTNLPPTAPSSPTTDVQSSSSTPGASGASLSRYQETKLVQRVLRGMEQLANGGGQVRLRLHPPELGALQMSLRIEGQVLTADMQVETSGARDALMKNLPLLKERLAEQGIHVEHFDVRTDNSNTSGGSGASSWGDQQRGESQTDRGESRSQQEVGRRNRVDASGAGPVEESVRGWTRTNGLIDVKA